MYNLSISRTNVDNSLKLTNFMQLSHAFQCRNCTKALSVSQIQITSNAYNFTFVRQNKTLIASTAKRRGDFTRTKEHYEGLRWVTGINFQRRRAFVSTFQNNGDAKEEIVTS